MFGIIRAGPNDARGRGARARQARPDWRRRLLRSSAWCIRSSWATIGASASTSRANPSRWVTRQAPDDRGHPLGDDRLEGGHGARATQFVLQAQCPRRIGDEVAQPDHRPLPGRHDGTPIERREAWPFVAVDLPAGRDGAQGRVQVVRTRRRDERLRQLGDAADEVRPPLGIELREHVVEEQERRTAVEFRQEVQLGQLEGQDGGPLLAARGEPGEVPAGQLEGQVVAMRPDQGRAIPDLLVGGLGKASDQRVARRLRRACRGVGDVAQPERARGRLLRRDLRVGGRQRLGEVGQELESLGDDLAAGLDEGGVPVAQLVARRAFLPDGAQQAVALLERARVGRLGVGVPGRARRRELIEGGSAQRRGACHQEHLLGGEDHDPEMVAERRGAPGDAVDADPLAARGPGRPGAHDGQFKRRLHRGDLRRGPGPCPSGSTRRRSRSGGFGPTPAARSPRAGWSCRPRWAPRRAAARPRTWHRARRTRAGHAG